MNNRMMHYRRLVPALCLVFLISIPSASASTISPDIERGVCIANPDESSQVIEFWDTLERDVRERRLEELDEQDPGLKASIESYINGGSAAASASDIQVRLDAIGAGEGLAMLIPEDPNAPVSNEAASTAEFQLEYSYDEARATIDAISDDPSAAVLEQLDAAATTRIAVLRASVFSERTADYNQTQFELREDFQSCISAIDDAKPIPTHYVVLAAMALVGLGAVAVRALSNSRKASRHGVEKHGS